MAESRQLKLLGKEDSDVMQCNKEVKGTANISPPYLSWKVLSKDHYCHLYTFCIAWEFENVNHSYSQEFSRK